MMLPDWRTQVPVLVEHGPNIALAILGATLSLLIFVRWVMS
jgi:hypothetical protein